MRAVERGRRYLKYPVVRFRCSLVIVPVTASAQTIQGLEKYLRYRPEDESAAGEYMQNSIGETEGAAVFSSSGQSSFSGPEKGEKRANV